VASFRHYKKGVVGKKLLAVLVIICHGYNTFFDFNNMGTPNICFLSFGARWHLAGVLARSLIIWLAVVFCNIPATIFARIIRIQRFVFFYDLVLLALRTATLVLGGMYLKVTQTVMVFAIVGAAMNIFLIYFVGRKVAKKEGRIDLLSLKIYYFHKATDPQIFLRSLPQLNAPYCLMKECI